MVVTMICVLRKYVECLPALRKHEEGAGPRGLVLFETPFLSRALET